ncbi:MAG: hypothetical protein H6740_13950 [Alphaproteobacteria bacterium]|nr:hypothetical protein [Alphaproteobacteria bacterium]
MSRRPIVLVAGLTALFTLGCMCGSVGDMIGEKVGEKISEEIAEEIVEAASGAEDVELDDDGASFRIETADGKLELNSKDGQAPEGFPLAIYPGAAINGSMKSAAEGKDGFFVLLTTTDSPKQVLEFYEKELKSKDMGEVTRTDINSDGKQAYMLAAEGGAMTAAIAIGEDDGKTNAMITLGPTK